MEHIRNQRSIRCWRYSKSSVLDKDVSKEDQTLLVSYIWCNDENAINFIHVALKHARLYWIFIFEKLDFPIRLSKRWIHLIIWYSHWFTRIQVFREQKDTLKWNLKNWIACNWMRFQKKIVNFNWTDLAAFNIL